MKSAALDWLRFTNRCFALATECGEWNSDVLGLNKRSSYEIEIKRSRSDFNNDFKKEKHEAYAKHGRWTPTYFYFLVPPHMEDWAIKKVGKVGPRYGVMVHEYAEFRSPYGDKKVHHYNRLRVSKRAKTLNNRKVCSSMMMGIMMRMGSEMCRGWHGRMEPPGLKSI